MKQILLSSKNKDIQEYTLVSDEDYEHLKQFKMYKDKDGYILTYINSKTWRLHRYILSEILRIKIERHNLIDHKNNNRIDNTRDNLRIVTFKENARNKLKQTNTSSMFYGVYTHNNGWRAVLKFDDNNLFAHYKTEQDCAYQYNLWIDQYQLTHFNKNNIEKPENFILYVKRMKKGGDLPHNIYKNRNKYQVQIEKYSKYFLTLEEAIMDLKRYKETTQNIPRPQIVVKNEKGDCIIELFNKKKEKVGETIVDEVMYDSLTKYRWYLCNGYVKGTVDKKTVSLHRHVMNYNGENYIDHINNNPLDNRICNLRIVTPAQNSMNKNIRKGGSSKYVGVSWYKPSMKWKAAINSKHIGYFNTEIDAAKARDLATIQYHGEHGILNFPITS